FGPILARYHCHAVLILRQVLVDELQFQVLPPSPSDIPQLRQVPGLDQRSRAVAPVRTGVEGISVARDARAALEVVEAVQVDLHHGRDLLDQSPACDAVIETGT